jgi:hypothetical protein
MNGVDESGQLKQSARYIGYRIFAAAVLVAWSGALLAAVTRNSAPTLVLFLLPLMLPALFMVFNLMAFKFSYSVFGPFERSGPPSEEPLEETGSGSGMVGLLHASWPFFSWTLYPSGLGFDIRGIGSGFVPFDEVDKIKKGIFGSLWIRHHSAEVRSPLVIGRGRLTRRMAELAESAPEGPSVDA